MRMFSYKNIMASIEEGKLVEDLMVSTEATPEFVAANIEKISKVLQWQSNLSGENEKLRSLKCLFLLIAYSAYSQANELSTSEAQQLGIRKDLNYYLNLFFAMTKTINAQAPINPINQMPFSNQPDNFPFFYALYLLAILYPQLRNKKDSLSEDELFIYEFILKFCFDRFHHTANVATLNEVNGLLSCSEETPQPNRFFDADTLCDQTVDNFQDELEIKLLLRSFSLAISRDKKRKSDQLVSEDQHSDSQEEEMDSISTFLSFGKK